MEVNFNVFYCTVCQFCKGLPTSLGATKFCSGCRMVQYCCSSHHKDDWPNHKELCKCIQRILKKTATDHVYKEAEQDSTSWNKLRMSVVHLVQMMMKRILTSEENQILLFPPVCNLCYRYKTNEMFPCYSCKTVMYCCSEHQESDEKHKHVCSSMSLSFDIDMLRLSKEHNAYDFSSLSRRFEVLHGLPEDMESLLKCKDNTLSNEDLLLSEPLSFTLTLIYVIVKVSKITSNNLSIHILGADSMEMLAMQTFPFLFRLLPNLTHLKVVMVGPNLPNTRPSQFELSKITFSLIPINMLYHEYVNSHSYVCPDVIAVFNCGFCEYSNNPGKDIWNDSLPCILDVRDCTVFLTSYTAKEATADYKRLCESKRSNVFFNVLLENKINPFSSLYPHRDWEAEHGGVFYVNKNISVLKT